MSWISLAIGVRARLGMTLLVTLLLTFAYGPAAGGIALVVGLAVSALGMAQQRFPALILPLIVTETVLVTAALFYAGQATGIAPFPRAMLFHSPAVLLLVALIAINALSIRPLATFCAGVSALACWYGAAQLTLAEPATLSKANLDGVGSLIEYLDAVMQPEYLSVDAMWFQLAVLAGCMVILTLASWRMRSLAREAAERQAALTSLSAHFAGPVAEALLSEGFERREKMQLSVLDCDLVGFSALAARMAPEAVAAGLRTYHAYVEETVFASGGAVLKYIGDGVIAVFGFTGAIDPAAQARDCAERLVAGWGASAAFEPAPELVVGVDHGEVVAGIVGEGRALSLIVAGPPVEGAARLQSLRGDQPAVRLGY